jgi:hypothetical protein
MVDSRVEDLQSLDRDVAHAFRALESFRKDLAANPASAAEADPFEGLRHVAGKSTWDALAEIAPSASDVPLRDALRRWVATFIQTRVNLAAEKGWASAAATPAGHLETDKRGLVDWRHAWRGVAHARSATGARQSLAAAAECGPALAELSATRAARRLEVALRMGWSHPWEGLISTPRAALREAALQLLRCTDDLAEAVRSETRGPHDAAATFVTAAARESSSGWPARLTPAWLRDVFRGEPRGVSLQLGVLPRPVGAASFARALVQFGFATRAELAPASLPFALRREPAFLEAHAFGAMLGSLAADPEFHARVLGQGRSGARGEARPLAKTMLIEARIAAARLLLGDEAAFAPSDLFTELSVRIFGSPLDARLRGAWPVGRDDEPARFCALAEASERLRDLREQFDVDWFLNPHAWDHLRAESSGAVRRAPSGDARDTSLAKSVDTLGHSLEEALG